MSKIERREIAGLEVRAERGEDGEEIRVIAGRGIPYGEQSADMGFVETIAPGAFRESLASGDIRALFNHDSNIVLGRSSAGTLRLEDRADGIHYEVDVNPRDSDAVNAAARIERGDITGNSFGMIVQPNGDRWEDRGGKLHRTIFNAMLLELGPQTFPAYPTTDVSTRSLDEIRAAGEAAVRAAREEQTPEGPSVDLLRRELELDEENAAI